MSGAAQQEVVSRFAIAVEQVDGYEFRVRFDKPQHEALLLDEPAPLGRDAHPNASRMLAAAVGNCLAASLVFCTSRKRIPVRRVTADVDVTITRNEHKRLRIGKIGVTLRPELGDGAVSLGECAETFEDFCVVTQSVRKGIDVDVRVEPRPVP